MKITASEWNSRYGIGQAVVYHSVVKDGDQPELLTTGGFPATTRSEAWTLPNGQHVVMIEGKAGGVALTHVVPV